MNEAQIKHMVDRFLGWKLPEDFNPDGGIRFEPIGNAGSAHEYKRAPVGTNLLDAFQAEAMIKYIVEGMPMRKELPVFTPGDIVEFCGEYATVVADHGSQIEVEQTELLESQDRTYRMSWYKIFEGTPVTLVSSAN